MIPAPPSLPYLTDCAGVFVGGCVERGVGSRFRSQAHAHTSGSHKGWVCFLSRRRVWTITGNPGRVWMHEVAHILTGHGHDVIWRAKMHELGQPIPKRYQRQRRSQ